MLRAGDRAEQLLEEPEQRKVGRRDLGQLDVAALLGTGERPLNELAHSGRFEVLRPTIWGVAMMPWRSSNVLGGL